MLISDIEANSVLLNLIFGYHSLFLEFLNLISIGLSIFNLRHGFFLVALSFSLSAIRGFCLAILSLVGMFLSELIHELNLLF